MTEQKIQDILFSRLSVVVHTAWFTAWLTLQLNINLLTLIVSLEAIYITLFIGLGQQTTHDHLKKLRKK